MTYFFQFSILSFFSLSLCHTSIAPSNFGHNQFIVLLQINRCLLLVLITEWIMNCFHLEELIIICLFHLNGATFCRCIISIWEITNWRSHMFIQFVNWTIFLNWFRSFDVRPKSKTNPYFKQNKSFIFFRWTIFKMATHSHPNHFTLILYFLVSMLRHFFFFFSKLFV